MRHHKIELSGKKGKGKFALVDEADFLLLSKYKWHLQSAGYAARRSGRGLLLMHTSILGAKDGFVIDHKNRNCLDNRSRNLRYLKNWENLHNSGLQKNNTSGVKGLCYSKDGNRKKRWFSYIEIQGKRIYSPRFEKREDAVSARRLLREMVNV